MKQVLNKSERKLRLRAVEAYKEVHGDVCPGRGKQVHYSKKLVAIESEPGELEILCPACSARKWSRRQ